MRRLLILAAVGMIVACATVTSRPQQSGQAGISYHLPAGKLSLTIVEADGIISVLLAGPVMQADPDYRLSAYLHRGTVSDNTTSLKVHDKTNLLTTVAVSSTGRLDDILKNLAGTVGAIQSGASRGGGIRYRALFGLDEVPQAQAEANAWLRAYHAGLCEGDQARRPADRTIEASQRVCRDLNQLQAAATPIDIGVEDPPVALAAAERVDLTRCRAGVCYRPLRPYRVTLTLSGISRQTDTMLFPDERQLMVVPMPSGVFATQKYDLAFTDGVLTSYSQTSESELVGLASLPIDIAKAILAAPGALLGAQRQALADEQAYLAAVAAQAAQAQSVRDLCARSPNDCPGTALRIIGASTGQAPAGGSNPGGSNSFEDRD